MGNLFTTLIPALLLAAGGVSAQDPARGERLHPVYTLKLPAENGDDSISSLAFAPDSSQVAAGTLYGTVVLWSTRTHEIDKTFDVPNGTVNDVTFDQSGKWLAESDVGGMSVWNANTGRQVHVILWPYFVVDVNSPSFSPDDALLAVGSSTSESSSEIDVIVWSTRTWRIVHRRKAHEHSVNITLFSPDGRLLAVSQGDKATVWAVTSAR
jgi:WD40 repeat protein